MKEARVLDIKRFAVHDGDGIRTTVFLKGCPLHCQWCHNPESISRNAELAFYEFKCRSCGECAEVCPQKAHSMVDMIHKYNRILCNGCGICEEVCPAKALKIYGKYMTSLEVIDILTEDKLFYDNSGGGITLSGGEALLNPEFCEEILCGMKEKAINTAVDTCGAVPFESFEKVIPFVDTFLYDIKAIDEKVHIRCTGSSNKLILKNFKKLAEKNCRVEVRIPFVPGYNDTEIPKIAEYLYPFKNVVKVRVLPYHDYARSKYLALGQTDTIPQILPTEESIQIAQSYFSNFN